MRRRASSAGVLLVTALAGCAPVALYRGPAPAPGAITSFAGGDWPHVVAGSTDAARHYLGALETPQGADSLVVLIYGDNRPGARTRVHPTLWRAVRKMSLTNPYRLGRGLLALPVFIFATIVPTLDGPRDALALSTNVPTGGGEVRVLKSLAAQPRADLVLSSGDLVTFGDRGKLWEIFAARFVILDSNALRDSSPEAAPLAEEQLAWADSVLASGPRLRFLVFHHPLLSAGHYRDPWDSNRPESVAARRRVRLLEMCAARHVTAVFAGHEHMYQRVYVETPDGGFWHVTSAGGGAPLYSLDPPIRDIELAKPLPAGMRIVRSSVNARSVYHFCRLVLPRGEAGDRPLAFDVLRVGAGGGTKVIDRIDLSRAPPAATAPP